MFRALQSALFVRQGYGQVDLPIEIMVQMHEEGGIYGGQHEYNLPGFTRDQVKEIIPDVLVPEAQEKLLDDKGWWKQETQETIDEVILRAKESVAYFKTLARGECKGKTIFGVSHAYFLHCFVYLLQS